MKSLRARLFAATLAALALTLALTIAIGGVLTRRQVDRTQAANIAGRADDLALQRREYVNYTTENKLSGKVRILIQPRASFASLVPDVNRSSDGQTTYLGTYELYSYRTLPHRGLFLLRPASLRSAARMSGRRRRRSEGRPTGTVGGWVGGAAGAASATRRACGGRPRRTPKAWICESICACSGGA